MVTWHAEIIAGIVRRRERFPGTGIVAHLRSFQRELPSGLRESFGILTSADLPRSRNDGDERISAGARSEWIACNILHPCRCADRTANDGPLGASLRWLHGSFRESGHAPALRDDSSSMHLWRSASSILPRFSVRYAGNEDMRPGKEPTLIRDWLPLDARRITLSSALRTLPHVDC